LLICYFRLPISLKYDFGFLLVGIIEEAKAFMFMTNAKEKIKVLKNRSEAKTVLELVDIFCFQI
jgi:hypothetical protein